MTGTTCGNGFVIGDGSLVVTARHVIFPQRIAGTHQGDVFVTAVSPYLGDACEMDVIAQDRELDVVLLRGPWKGHPALPLAEDAELGAAAGVRVTAFTDAVAAVVAGRAALVGDAISPVSAELAVDSVTVRQGETRTIVTATSAPGAGWAGAPMNIGNSCGGVYSRTQANGAAGVGVAVGPIRKLIDAAKVADAMKPSPKSLPVGENAPAATAFFLKSIAASAGRDVQGATAYLQSLLKLRPNCAVALRDAAGQARAAGKVEEAMNLYAEAVKSDPALVSARVLYAQVLHDRVMPDHAIEQLRYAWEHGRGSTAAVIPLCNILREQGKVDECATILAKAVEQNPSDSFLWNYLAQARVDLREHTAAAEAYAKAADLMPENEPLRANAGEQFEAAGDRKRAEMQYRMLVERNRESSSGHFFLARFLARDKARKEEALREAELSLKLSGGPDSPPRVKIEDLIRAIRTGKSGDELHL